MPSWRLTVILRLMIRPIRRSESGVTPFTTALTETFTRVVLGGVNGNTDTGTSPINFSQAPVVALTFLAEDVNAGSTPVGNVGQTQVTSITTMSSAIMGAATGYVRYDFLLRVTMVCCA